MDWKTNDGDGEENLNWPLSVLLFCFAPRKQTNNTVTDSNKKWLVIDMTRYDRKSLITLYWDQDGQTGWRTHKNHMILLSWFKSGPFPAAASTYRENEGKESSWLPASTIWPPCPSPRYSHKHSTPSSARHRVGLGCQLSLVVNTWLTTPTPSSASQDLCSSVSCTNVRRGQVYKKKEKRIDQHI